MMSKHRTWARGCGVQVWAAPRWQARHCVLRCNIMDVAREQALTVKEQAFTLTEIYSASEVFITSASSGVVPVVEVPSPTLRRPDTGCAVAISCHCCCGRLVRAL